MSVNTGVTARTPVRLNNMNGEIGSRGVYLSTAEGDDSPLQADLVSRSRSKPFTQVPRTHAV